MAPLTVQIIDDGMELCRELRGWLEQAGHTVICAAPHRTTLARLVEAPPGLFVIGIASAGSAGLPFYQRLVTHRQLRHVPIIAASDAPDLEYELLDAYDFHVRPFDRRRLLASVSRLGETAGNGRSALLGGLTNEALAPFRALLLERSGLNFSTSNQRLLERGLLHRMQALQLTAPAKYLAYLSRETDNHDELNKLLGLLTIGETCFFRYRTHREALISHVLPELLAGAAARRRLRIWSAGCSTGEEPYSLAMVLLEHFPELHDWQVQILATDINKRALRQAREGIYGARALRQTDAAYRQRYFRQVDDHFVLDRRVQSLVRFGYLNLQDGQFPAAGNDTAELDLILCRNVLIYFQPQTIRQIVRRFADCLRPGGFLFLGHAETLQGISDRFHRVHQHGAFFYQRKAGEEAEAPPFPVAASCSGPAPPVPASATAATPVMIGPVAASPGAPALPPAPDTASAPALYAAAVAAFDREEFAAAEQLFDRLLAAQPDHGPALVGKGLLCANRGDYQAARQWCARAIRHDDLLPDAYLLRGLILDMEGHLERALVEYQKALWLDREMIMAHLFSARAHGRLGSVEAQRRALRNAIRILEKRPGTAVVPYSGGLSRPVLLQFCRRELSALPPSG